jgi:hypothetical protein
MRGIRRLVCGVVSAGAVGVLSSSAIASPSTSPTPVPGSPGCVGVLVASINHDSGPFGNSGNPNSSAGPGSFLGPDTHGAIQDVRAALC